MFEKIADTLEMVAIGAAGATVSLLFRQDLKTLSQRCTAVAGGTSTAYFVSPLALDYFHMEASRAGSVTFLLGLFGMSVVATLMQSIPEIVGAVRQKLGA